MAEMQERVRLATSEWPPYVGSDVEDNGFLYIIIRDAFKNSGYEPVIEFLPWDQAKQLDQNHNDAYFPEYDNSDPTLACSYPIYAGPIGLYKKADNQISYSLKNPGKYQERAFQDLNRYTFGVVKGYINTQVFDSMATLKKQAVTNDLENLEQLDNDQVDLIIIDVFVAEHLIDKHKPDFDDISFMGPSLENKKLYVCFSKRAPNYAKKLEAFNNELARLQDSGELYRIIDSHKF